MARFYYSETYTETDVRKGVTRQFKREFGIEGSKDEIKELMQEAFARLPKYNYPVLKARQEAFDDMKYLLE